MVGIAPLQTIVFLTRWIQSLAAAEESLGDCVDQVNVKELIARYLHYYVLYRHLQCFVHRHIHIIGSESLGHTFLEAVLARYHEKSGIEIKTPRVNLLI